MKKIISLSLLLASILSVNADWNMPSVNTLGNTDSMSGMRESGMRDRLDQSRLDQSREATMNNTNTNRMGQMGRASRSGDNMINRAANLLR